MKIKKCQWDWCWRREWDGVNVIWLLNDVMARNRQFGLWNKHHFSIEKKFQCAFCVCRDSIEQNEMLCRRIEDSCRIFWPPTTQTSIIMCVQIDDKQLHKNNLLLFSLCLYLRSVLPSVRVDDDKNWFTRRASVVKKGMEWLSDCLRIDVNRRNTVRKWDQNSKVFSHQSESNKDPSRTNMTKYETQRMVSIQQHNAHQLKKDTSFSVRPESDDLVSCIVLYGVTPSFCLQFRHCTLICVHVNVCKTMTCLANEDTFASRFAPGEWI